MEQKITHISQIRGLKPESIAFISYVMNQYVSAPYESLAFLFVDKPFLKARAAYLAIYRDSIKKVQAEFWIIEANALLSGMAVRTIKDGEVDEISFINFVMRPYCVDAVKEAIKELPINGITKH